MATIMGGGTQYEGDRNNLVLFLLDTRNVLQILLEIRHVLMPEYLQDELSEAWRDVDVAFEDTVAVLRGGHPRDSRRPWPPALQFDPEELDVRLAFFGLTGAQLQLKLSSFRATLAETLEEPSFMHVMTSPATNETQRATKRRKGKLMEWLLEKINAILGSLARAIPSVDIIKEFKEMAEYGYKESQHHVAR